MKKYIRQIVMFVAVVAAVLGNGTVAYADVIYEPEDSFYKSHAAECSSEERSYTANGPDGKVTVYASPNNSKVNGTLENGSSNYVYYTYFDGDNSWAYVEGSNYVDGWVPMAYLQEKYDSEAFSREHRDQLVYDGWSLDDKYCDMDINVWLFPGDNEPATTVNVSSRDNCMGGSPTYEDEFGNKWAYFDYYYAMHGWLCISNPAASYDELYPNGGPVCEIENQDNNSAMSTEIIEPKSHATGLLLGIGVLIIVVIVVTLVLIKRLGKGKEKKNNEKKNNEEKN